MIGTNGCHEKLENERFSAAGSRCRQNLKFEIFTASFGRVRQRNVRNVQYYSFRFLALLLPLPPSFIKLFY